MLMMMKSLETLRISWKDTDIYKLKRLRIMNLIDDDDDELEYRSDHV